MSVCTSDYTPHKQAALKLVLDVHLWQQAQQAGAKFYMKTNLLGNESRIRQYPWTDETEESADANTEEPTT